MSRAESLADELYEAHETGDLATIGALAEELLEISRDPEHRLMATLGLIKCQEAAAALEILEALSAETLEEDQREFRTFQLSECWFALGEPERALELIESVPSRDPEDAAAAQWRIGLCHDHLGDRVQADLCFREAHRLDPVNQPLPTSIGPDEAEAIVSEVLTRLPEPLRRAAEEIPIVVEDLPPLAWIRSSRGEVHPETLGLYTGQSLQDRSHFDPGGLPSMIHIFRRNLERFALDREALEEEVRVTLLHELGHHLGLDEDEVDRLGLG